MALATAASVPVTGEVMAAACGTTLTAASGLAPILVPDAMAAAASGSTAAISSALTGGAALAAASEPTPISVPDAATNIAAAPSDWKGSSYSLQYSSNKKMILIIYMTKLNGNQ